MPTKFARSNGDFNGPIWALASNGVAGSTSAPTIGDNAVANTFIVQITGSVACDLITNNTAYGGTVGGTFNLNNNSQLSAIITASGPGAVYLTDTTVLSGSNSSSIFSSYISQAANSSQQFAVVRHTSSGTLTIATGTITGGFNNVAQACDCVIFSGNGVLDITGNIVGGGGSSSGVGVRSSGSGSTIIRGNIYGGSSSAGPGILNTSTGPITVYGNLNGSSAAFAISNTSTGPITVYGNLNGSSYSAISNTSTGSVTVLGNIIGNVNGGYGIASSSPAAPIKISGNLICAPNGVPAIYAPFYIVSPLPSQTYIRYANNGIGVGPDAYLYQYTTDSLSAFAMPPVSAVRSGVSYANDTLVGTYVVPSVSSVSCGVPVDNSVGTAYLNTNNLFDVAMTSLTASNSLGERLKNSANISSIGYMIASFSN